MRNPQYPPSSILQEKEPSTIQMFCIHHQNNNIGTYEQRKLLKDIAYNLQILQSHTQIAPPIPSNTNVNPSKKWSKSNYPYALAHNNIPAPQFPSYQTNLPLKFHPQFSYYMDGSFIKPKEIAPGVWRRERAGYGIYSPKGLNIAKRLHGHQNILCA